MLFRSGIATQNYLGKENALAVRGTFLHMMNHSLFKLVLFIVAGIIFMNLHNLNLNEIRGFGRKKPLLHFAYLMGALGIGGIPLWSGYISKTLLHESIVECINVTNNHYTPFKLVEWIFLISGGLTVAYMLKLYICLFIEKNLDITRQEKFEKNYTHYMNKATTFSLLGSAILLPFLGFTANKTMMYLSDFSVGFMNGAALEHSIHFYSWENLRGSVVSIAIGIVLYCVVVRGLLMRKSVDYVDKEYINAWPKWIDIEDYIYRPILLKVFPFIGAIICRGYLHPTLGSGGRC